MSANELITVSRVDFETNVVCFMFLQIKLQRKKLGKSETNKLSHSYADHYDPEEGIIFSAHYMLTATTLKETTQANSDAFIFSASHYVPIKCSSTNLAVLFLF